MSELNDLLNDIKTQKDTYIIPENVKAGVTVMGVTGTLQAGVDTSDATATAGDIITGKTAYAKGEKITGTATAGIDTSDASATATDIASGKTAYVNGEKITGSLSTVEAMSTILFFNPSINNSSSDSTLRFTTTINNDTLYKTNARVQALAKYNNVATAIELTPEQIVTGNTVLGVVGTGGSANGNTSGAKVFSTIEEMNADTDKQEGQLAILCGPLPPQLVEDGKSYSTLMFPHRITVTKPFNTRVDRLDMAITGSDLYTEAFVMAYSNGTNIYFSGEQHNLEVQYAIESGTTFVLDKILYDFVEQPAPEGDYTVDLGNGVATVAYSSATSAASEFVYTGSGEYTFNGIYICNSDLQYELLKTQIDTTNPYVFSGKTFYGQSGIDTGTLGSTINSKCDDPTSEAYAMTQMYYDTLPIIYPEGQSLHAAQYFSEGSTRCIPTKSDGTSIIDTTYITDMSYAFFDFKKLVYVSALNTEQVTVMDNLFSGCVSLQYVPKLNMQNISGGDNVRNMFYGCTKLSDESLNNILYSISKVQLSGSTNLSNLGLTTEQIERCKTLSNYQVAIDAGWTD